MILKKLEDGVVVSAVEIKSFESAVVSHENRATVTVILDCNDNREVTYSQEPGDKHIYQIVDNNNNIIRFIHQ